MPARSNEFQKVVKYIYDQVTPIGGRVTESAMLRENPGNTEREVDVLVELNVAGHDIKIAIECREHTRDQTIEWIDSLIGKYSGLRVNKIVAISATSFSDSAKSKAAAKNIELITVNEALTTEWRRAVETWNIMTHRFSLMRIMSFDSTGNEITRTDMSEDGKIPTHKDADSEQFYYFAR